MSLEQEITTARKEILADGYDMSFGEVMNLYRDNELIIDPEFQRLFRWNTSQKTRFIESLLLGIPIPSIFVFQNDSGIWELIDGLQRLSTVLEFAGMLYSPERTLVAPSFVDGTKSLPSLAGVYWEESAPGTNNGIGKSQQLQIKRARIRVEILKRESDPQAKYELFQRLNTGGSQLSPQEVRNCVAVMLSKPFHRWLTTLTTNTHFTSTISQTDSALKKQSGLELALRFIAFRNVKYQKKLDVHEYLDAALVQLATDENLSLTEEGRVFEQTFRLLDEALGNNAFKKWDGTRFQGMFLLSVFEVLATGVSKNLGLIQQMQSEQQKEFVVQKAKELWGNPTFQANSGAGIRGTTRLTNLLPLADQLLRP